LCQISVEPQSLSCCSSRSLVEAPASTAARVSPVLTVIDDESHHRLIGTLHYRPAPACPPGFGEQQPSNQARKVVLPFGFGAEILILVVMGLPDYLHSDHALIIGYAQAWCLW